MITPAFTSKRTIQRIMTQDLHPNLEIIYPDALALVQHLDQHLTANTRHYRNRTGDLLTNLDQLINAILEDNLQPETL